MTAFDQLLRELVAPERQVQRSRTRLVQGTVDSVSGGTAVVALLGGVTHPLRYPAGAPIAPGSLVQVAVRGTSVLHIAQVMEPLTP